MMKSSQPATTTIDDLLSERHINWVLIQARAKTNKDSFPSDFLAKIVLVKSSPPFDLFEWFLLQFGGSACLSGYNQEELREVKFGLYNYGNHFIKCKSLESARLYWLVFGESYAARRNAFNFVVGCFPPNFPSSDPWTATNMSNIDVWACYMFLLPKLIDNSPAINKQGDVLAGHTVLHVMLTLPERYASNGHTGTNLLGCLRFLHKHKPNVFQEQDEDGNTVLGLVLNKSTQVAKYSLYIRRGKWGCGTIAVVKLILQLAPEACLIRNVEGRLLLHRALENGMFASARLLHTACPSTVDYRCPATGLYPFQLAATAQRTTCECSLCIGRYTPLIRPLARPQSSLTTSYILLRQSPHLLAASFVAPVGEENQD